MNAGDGQFTTSLLDLSFDNEIETFFFNSYKNELN